MTGARTRALAWAAAATWCLVALVATGAALVLSPAGAALDVAMYDAVTQHVPTSLHLRADAVARLVDPAAYAVWVVLLCAVALVRGRPRVALAVSVVAVGSALTTQLLKVGLAHPRAADAFARLDVDAASWPSGHATAAATLALCAVLVAPAALRPAVAVLACAAAAAVGLATLVAEWHLPSDVLGGAFVAGAWAAGAAAVLAALPRRRSPAVAKIDRLIPAP